MGWRGTIRSMNAAAKRQAKASERKSRDIQHAHEIALAGEAVDKWQVYLDRVTSVHHIKLQPIQWEEFLKIEAPIQPKPSTNNYEIALKKLEKFNAKKDGFFFRKNEKQKAKLEAVVADAKKKDDQLNASLYSNFQDEFDEWQEQNDTAKKMLKNDPVMIISVINEMQTISENELVGKSLNIEYTKKGMIVHVQVHGDDIVPDFKRKQLQSGKLSETKMPKSEFNELYQDYVVSVAYRAALEVLNLTCLDAVIVDCSVNMLDSSTGHILPQIILSVDFKRNTIQHMQLDKIDPSDSLVNFIHNMKFSRTKGFSAVSSLSKT